MARIPIIESKDSLPKEHHALFDAITRSRGQVRGPFTALLHSPALAERTANLGAFVRFESQLDPKVVELATLAVARELECKHEWAAHVAQAEKVGVPLETIRAIYQRKSPESFSLEDAQIVSYVQELLRSHRASEATLQALLVRLEVKGVVELTAAIGYFAMLACTLNAFDVVSVEAPEDLKI